MHHRSSIAHRKRRGYRWSMLFEVLIVLICTVALSRNVVDGYNSTRISVPRIPDESLAFANKNHTSYLGYHLNPTPDSSLPTNISADAQVLFDDSSNLNSTTIQSNSNSTVARASQDDMITSDSRNYHSISRDDEPPTDTQGSVVADTPTEEDTVNELENYIDEASSNLNEKKVVKEITKMLSKGMSGATDQVKLETLENWKRRQKERKVVKDSRAKLFEDLLSAAISSHPDKIKKRTKKPKIVNHKPAASSLTSNPDIDPELALDADNVISHLHGIASVIDGHSPSNGLALPVGTSLSTPENTENLSPTAGLFGDSNDETSDGSQSGETEKEVAKKAKPSSDRLIVKQFKKIKHQISQRRKQLDQIKKIFNVELSLNPKDGSLMGKSTSGKKTNKENSMGETSGNSEEEPEEGGSSPQSMIGADQPLRRNKNAKSRTKMKELMDYLRDNPEILASVMSELTVDAEPGVRGSTSSGGHTLPASSLRDEESHIIAPENTDLPQSRRSIYHPREQQRANHDIERLPYESENFGHRHRSSYPRRALVRDTHFDISNQLEHSPETAYSTASVRRAKDRDELAYSPPVKSLTSQLKVKSAESLLLESLRERQLMNLARLDMVLAERQMASNRSHPYASSNSSSSSLLSRRDSLDYQRPTSRKREANSPGIRLGPSGSKTQQQIQNQQSDGEVLHHFMMVNQDGDSASHSSVASAPTDGNMNNHPDQFSRFTDRLTSSGQASDNSIQGLYGHQLSGREQQNSLSSMASRFMDQQQPQQPNQQTLGRFKDWRDVSQVETSPSILNDKTNYHPSNVTWVPYDLSTGGSVNTITDAHKSASTINNHYHRHIVPPSPSASTMTPTTATAAHQQEIHNETNQDNGSHLQDGNKGGLNPKTRQDSRGPTVNNVVSHHDHGDSSITRPSLSLSTGGVDYSGGDQMGHQANRIFNDYGSAPDNTVFMTRSTAASAIEPSTFDSSTPSTIRPRSTPSENTILNRDIELIRQQPERHGAEAELRSKTSGTKSNHGDTTPTDDSSMDSDQMSHDDEVSDDGGGVSGSHASAPTVDYFSAYKQELPPSSSRKRLARSDQVGHWMGNSSSNRFGQRLSNRRVESRHEPMDIVERDDMGAMWAKAK